MSGSRSKRSSTSGASAMPWSGRPAEPRDGARDLPRRLPGMSRRAATLIVASVLILLLGMAAALIPVPYVALQPGPTSDTLGRLGKAPLIQITGAKTYPTKGHLNFVTVAYQGGPGNRIDLFTALRGWLDPDVAIVPEEVIFPKNESTKQVEQQNTAEMTNSQEAATAAALHELHLPMTLVTVVD